MESSNVLIRICAYIVTHISNFLTKLYANRKTIIIIAISTTIFALCAYAFTFANIKYYGDEVVYDQLSFDGFKSDTDWKIYIGRYLQPVYWTIFRGAIVAPFLIGSLFIVFSIMANFVTVKIFQLNKTSCIIIACAILTVNPVYLYLAAFFIEELDINALAYLCTAIAIYIIIKNKDNWKCFLGSIPILCSTALYQSFLEVPLFVILIFLIKFAIENKPFKQNLYYFAKFYGTIALGLVLYFLIFLIIKNSGLYRNDLPNLHNSLSQLFSAETIQRICSSLINAYSLFFNGLFKIYGFNRMTIIDFVSGLSLIIIIALLVLMVIRNKTTKLNIVIASILFLIFPFTINVIHIVSSPTYLLPYTYFSYNFIFIWPVFLYQLSTAKGQIKNPSTNKTINAAVSLSIISISIFSTILANQFSVEAKLRYDHTYDVLSRVIDTIENYHDPDNEYEYKINETPVLFVGDLNNGPYAAIQDNYKPYYISNITPFYNVNTIFVNRWLECKYGHFINWIMKHPMKVVENIWLGAPTFDIPEIKNLKCFPYEGCCGYITISDVTYLTIKLSDY